MEARLKCWECGRRVIPAGMRSHRERGCEPLKEGGGLKGDPKQAGQRDSRGNQRGNGTSGDKTRQEKKR
jgi:hypothetical protein